VYTVYPYRRSYSEEISSQIGQIQNDGLSIYGVDKICVCIPLYNSVVGTPEMKRPLGYQGVDAMVIGYDKS
jgi:hypothetical protein